MNRSEATYDQKQLIADLIGCDCFGIGESISLSEYDESMEEINNMISWFIMENDEKEVAFWRQMLQQTRVEKRRVKKMIDNSRMEVAHT